MIARLDAMKYTFPLLVAALWCSAEVRAADWYNWRGPEQNGFCPETGLPDRFTPDPKAPNSNCVWTAPYGARSAPLVMNGRVFIINQTGESVTQQERVMAFDADTGKVLWEHKFNVWHTDIVVDRLGWTNLAGDPETGNVYAHGTQGLLLCFNRDGKVLWSHSLTEEYGRISGYGGRIVSPMVDGDLVVVGMLNASWGDQARGGNRFLALDKKTGTPVYWASPAGQPKDTYYSYPVSAVINGERLILSGGADGGIHAFKAHTGEKVWSYVFGTSAVNVAPAVQGTRVWIAHAEENPDNNIKGRVICLDAGQVKEGKPKLLWKRDGLRIKFASPVLHEGRLYVADEGATLHCLDAATGKTLWQKKYGRSSMGSPVMADGKIYVGAVNSVFSILKPGDKSCDTLYKYTFPGKGGINVEINGTPAVANGRVFFATSEELLCIGKGGGQVGGTDTATATDADLPEGGRKAAHLQLLPADIVLHPGESVSFKARLFDGHGRFLKETDVENLDLPSPPPPSNSKLTPPALRGDHTGGKFTAAKEVPGQQGLVTAKADGVSGTARVRVAPRIPYRNNFEKVPVGATPGGWVNTQGKFAVVEKDGAKVLKKLATNPSPLVARANAYIAMPSLTGYTIQADVQGAKAEGDLPDVGVVANRYTLMLVGNTQQLRLISWDALPRVDKTIAWPWKPGVWYTLKLTVDVDGDKAVVRGKIWEREKAEPAEWTVEFTDPAPNKQGSPALYGFAAGTVDEKHPGAEIYYANVKVEPNNHKQAGNGK
jgi:outer membrane protein assembly factor BamB